jgi:hypothetical protein
MILVVMPWWINRREAMGPFIDGFTALPVDM